MKILVIGASGQIGSELVPFLKQQHGPSAVVVSRLPNGTADASSALTERETQLDITNRDQVKSVIAQGQFDRIYQLAGILSARGEQSPSAAWEVNLTGLKNVLDAVVETRPARVFWPSSIAAFGPTTPREKTPQWTVQQPTTMYGVTKVAGELLVQYYYRKYHLDIRSLRLPGIISYKTEPGGGTTDYAVAMYYHAIQQTPYTCFVRSDTVLPMMYMDDAIQAIETLMNAPAETISVRTSYNLTALHFSAQEEEVEIKKHVPSFSCRYEPDFRQSIADSWPRTIDDSQARKDWGWQPRYDLPAMTEVMLSELRRKLKTTAA